jgi:hypothetical protein
MTSPNEKIKTINLIDPDDNNVSWRIQVIEGDAADLCNLLSEFGDIPTIAEDEHRNPIDPSTGNIIDGGL